MRLDGNVCQSSQCPWRIYSLNPDCFFLSKTCRLATRLQGLEERVAGLDDRSRAVLSTSAGGWLGALKAERSSLQQPVSSLKHHEDNSSTATHQG
jgi:hypothetical protein